MEISRIKRFCAAWLRYLGRGAHVLVALMISGFVVQVLSVAVFWLVQVVSGSESGSDGPMSGILIPAVFFILVGLPLFGFLFSRAYSPSEPVAVDRDEPGGEAVHPVRQ
jgi:hypothetical protein